MFGYTTVGVSRQAMSTRRDGVQIHVKIQGHHVAATTTTITTIIIVATIIAIIMNIPTMDSLPTMNTRAGAR